MTGQEITPGIRTALGVATAAERGTASPHGLAATVVLALAAAGLLQSPGTTAELERLRRRCVLAESGGADERDALCRLSVVAPFTAELRVRYCPAGRHRPWLADAPDAVTCPWCAVARLLARADQVEVCQVLRDDVPVATYTNQHAAAAHAEAELHEQIPCPGCEWIARPDASGVLDLVTRHRGHTSATPYAVVLLDVRTEYTPAVTA